MTGVDINGMKERQTHDQIQRQDGQAVARPLLGDGQERDPSKAEVDGHTGEVQGQPGPCQGLYNERSGYRSEPANDERSRLSTYLPLSLRERLKVAAKKDHRSASAVLRMLIQEYVDNVERRDGRI